MLVSEVMWDYIVVGGGLAGTVVSNRLHQYNHTAKILVVEAGPDVSCRTDIMYANSTNTMGGDFDWKYKSVPQASWNGRQIELPSGKAVGGGSAINACGWYRGNRHDYDDWADLVGDDRWSYDSMLPFFKKTEIWYDRKNAEYHGLDGALHISSSSSTNRTYPLEGDLQASWNSLGVQSFPFLDMNTGDNIGLGAMNDNRHKGARQVANVAYPLDGATVLTDTLVESILIEKESSARAVGIKLANGTEYYSKEVIVSAGAYRTPQLLMLSGVGPTDVLSNLGIEQQVDAPEVGRNYADHPMISQVWRLRDPSKGYAIGSDNPLFSEPQYGWGYPISYVVSNAVPRAGLIEAIVKDEGSAALDGHPLLRNERPSIENLVLYVGSSEDPKVAADGTHIGTSVMSMLPTSRGTVTINSTDPNDPPLMDPNYVATEVDRYTWRVAFRNITELMTGGTIMGRNIVAEESPPSGFAPMSLESTDEYLDARIRAGGISTFHGMGTCSMGKVVDANLRVKGVDNLRIVDASVLPVVITSHIQATVYALAERAADIITTSG